MKEVWLTSKEIRTRLKISPQSLYGYEKTGKIKTKSIYGKKFYLWEDSADMVKKLNIIYARVSNTKQREDLVRQETLLKEYVVKNGHRVDLVISDIASGMNEGRVGFNRLLKHVIAGEVETVFLSCKDRLTRFGYGYFETIFNEFGTKIEVVNLTQEEDFQSELVEDMISIIHHFSTKMYSNRRKHLKELEKSLKDSHL